MSLPDVCLLHKKEADDRFVDLKIYEICFCIKLQVAIKSNKLPLRAYFNGDKIPVDRGHRPWLLLVIDCSLSYVNTGMVIPFHKMYMAKFRFETNYPSFYAYAIIYGLT